MKTHEQCREEILTKFNDGLIEGPVTFGKIEYMAAKEYAKQWVHEFALQTFHHLDSSGYNDIITQLEPEIIKRIEEQ